MGRITGSIEKSFKVVITLDAPITAEAEGVIAHTLNRIIDEYLIKAFIEFGTQSPSESERQFYKELSDFWRQHFKDAIVEVVWE